jgi:hypothetical protein
VGYDGVQSCLAMGVKPLIIDVRQHALPQGPVGICQPIAGNCFPESSNETPGEGALDICSEKANQLVGLLYNIRTDVV